MFFLFLRPLFFNAYFWIIVIYSRLREPIHVQSRTEILLLLAVDEIEWEKL